MITPLRSTHPHLHSTTYQAIVLLADVPSPTSRRIYTEKKIRDAAEVLQNRIDTTSILGESGSSVSESELRINLTRVSHRIEKVMIVDVPTPVHMIHSTAPQPPQKGLEVTIETMPTPHGMTVKKMIDMNIDLFLWMRGTGRVAEDGRVSELDIFTFDIDVMQNLNSFESVRKL